MAFPDIPTTAGSTLLTAEQANTTATRTFPSLSSLTKQGGDLLLAIIVAYQSSATANTVWSSWGASFTEFMDTSTTSTVAIGGAYKWSTGSETGTFTVTQAATVTGHANMMLMSIHGAHFTTPPEFGGSVASTNSNADAGSYTTSAWGVEDTLWITVCGVGETSTAGSFQGVIGGPSSPWTDYAETAISQDVVGGMDMGISFNQESSDTVDPGAFNTDTSNTRWRAVTIAVRPSVGPQLVMAPMRAP